MRNSFLNSIISFFRKEQEQEVRPVSRKGDKYGTKYNQTKNNHGRKSKTGFGTDKVSVRSEINFGARIFGGCSVEVQTRRDLGCIRGLAQGLSFEPLRDREVSERRLQYAEADRLVSAAKSLGLYVSDDEVKHSGQRVTKISGESMVYVDAANDMVVKAKDPYARSVTKRMHFQDAIFEHIIHNILFPETRYEFVGINGGDGDLRLMLTQKIVPSYCYPTQKQIADYMENVLGLRREDEYSWGNDLLSVTDVEAGSDNALIGIDDKIYFIDPLIRLKSPAINVIQELTGIDVRSEVGMEQ